MQRRIRPDEVLPEWQKEQQVLGTQADVQRELRTALALSHPPAATRSPSAEARRCPPRRPLPRARGGA
ncbi:MAG: hypothetical protein AB7C98_04155 [Acidithiobacillus sp.]